MARRAIIDDFMQPIIGASDLDWDDPINNGIVARWPTNEGAGGRIADLTGRNHGTFKIASWGVPFNTRQCLSFPGTSNSGISIALANSLTAFTWCAWVNPTTQVLNAYNNMMTFAGTRGVWLKNGKVNLFFSADHLGTTATTTGVWQHAGATVDASGNVVFYFNGLPDGTTTLTPAAFAPNGIGCDSSGGEGYTGFMLDVGLWSRVLSAAEVNRMYLGGPMVGLMSPQRRSRAAVLPHVNSGLLMKRRRSVAA